MELTEIFFRFDYINLLNFKINGYFFINKLYTLKSTIITLFSEFLFRITFTRSLNIEQLWNTYNVLEISNFSLQNNK